MVGIDFIGRLGNQMFTYAFARMLMEKHGDKAFVANFKRSQGTEGLGWGDSLHCFNILPYTTVTYDQILKNGKPLQRVLYLLYMFVCKLPLIHRNDTVITSLERTLRSLGMHFTGAADAAYEVETMNGPVFVRGYFQDKRFFNTIRPILLREFTPKHSPLNHNHQLYQAASRPGSVCVSVRRGDYMSAAYKKDFYVCTPEYYEKAIRLICQKVENPVFIFFSDDIQWVRENMSVEGHQCYYERGDDPVWEKLRMMYNCHHFIISNSTFAWWASYLADRKGKIAVAPNKWFANPNWHSNLPDRDDFTLIDPFEDK